MRGNTEGLAALLRPAMEALLPRQDAGRARRADAALQDDGKISPYALRGAIHHAARWYVAGTLSTGNNLGEEVRIQADGALERLDVRVKTAPTGADLKVRLRRANVTAATVTIPAGETSAGVVLGAGCSAGDVLTIDVTQVGSGVAGANLSVCVTHREERRS
jgi:hypothetical protein